MGNPLNPTLLNRITRLLRPDFARTVLARRIAAGFLALLAAAAALRPDPAGMYSEVAVAVRDLSPGVTLTQDDVRAEKRPVAALPDGVLRDPDPLLGATVAGPVRRGEMLTDARVLGSRLATLSAGPNARVVPLHLADAAVPDLIRAGDVVDVLGAPEAAADARPRVLATDAVVVLVSAEAKGFAGQRDRVVLVALPAAAAHVLAAASLVQSVTLTIH